VNSVGFSDAAEVDEDTVRDALVAVESRAAALGDYPNGAFELAGITDAVEIGELIAGTREGRTSDDQLTLYKSVGVAVQDAAAAALVLRAARERGVGTDVAL
jgi:ornithine cyclodeaminase/alanine dehydrogenase-like protein (mu-crystallin family)